MTPTAPTLWEDEFILAVDKPAGRTVIPGRIDVPEACLRRVLERERRERLWVVHRLDRDTSGVLLFAKSAEAHKALNGAFTRHEVRKSYLAVTRGAPAEKRGEIATPLHTARRNKMRPAVAGEKGSIWAESEYLVLRRWRCPSATVALIEVRPRTGRQHQIRVHLRSIGAPLLLDTLYGSAEPIRAGDLGLPGNDVLCSRLTLHARSIEFPHPKTKKRIRVEAAVPADLAGMIAALDRAAAPS